MVRERAILPPKIIAIKKAAVLTTKIKFGRLRLMNLLFEQKAQPEILIVRLNVMKIEMKWKRLNLAERLFLTYFIGLFEVNGLPKIVQRKRIFNLSKVE